MDPARIGLVCPYSLDVPGGVGSHVLDLAGALSARGHDVRVAAPGESARGLPAYVTVLGKATAIPYNGSVGRLLFGPRASSRVRSWLADSRLDVLHVHEPASPSVSMLALWASTVPTVATFHTSIPRSRALLSASGVLRTNFEKLSARIAVSELARATLVQHLGGEPLIIPNGVWCHSFADAEPREEWSSPGPVVGFLGRFEERKGLHVLLEALPELVARHPNVRVLVAGRGDAAPVEALPPDLRRHVELLGGVSDDDKARMLRSVDVYVAPNTGGESQGIVLNEAMAAGACVVASDLPAFRIVLGEGAYGALFATGSAAGLASTVSDLLDDADRRRALAEAGSRRSWAYDWSAIAPRIEGVYDTIALADRVVRGD